MLNFGSQKNQNDSNQLPTQEDGVDNIETKKNNLEPTVDHSAIHVMPGKFSAQKNDQKIAAASKASGSKSSVKKIIIFSLLFFIFSVGVVGGVFWYFAQMEDSAPSANDQINQGDQNIVTPEPTPTPPTPEPTPTPTPPTVINIDADNDLLTYEEEILYSTDPNNPDTDRDGYSDGLEIINLYNPLGSGLLEDSGLVTRFFNSLFNYSLLKPTDWVAQAITDDLGQIMILPDTETGEFFIIYSRPNQDNWSLSQARVELEDLLAPTTSMQNYSLAGQVALRSADKKKVLMSTGSHIYIFIYESGAITSANFHTTFEMILGSFELLENNLEMMLEVSPWADFYE